MGLYVNTRLHPTLFKNDRALQEPNQEYFKSDYLKEVLYGQSKMNESFQSELKKMRVTMQKQQFLEEKRWNEIVVDIVGLKVDSGRHQQFEKQTREWIAILEKNSQELHRIVTENSSINQEILNEIHRIHQSNEEIVEQLVNFDKASQEITSKINEIADKQDVMVEHVATQNKNHGSVLEHLENQEALMEKSNRQLDNLRSILFERTSFIADKIEESYKLTSSYIYKFLTGSEKPVAWMMLNQKRESSKSDKDSV